MTWRAQLKALTANYFAGYEVRRNLARHLGVLETRLTKWLAEGGIPSEQQQARISEVLGEARSGTIELDSGA